MRGSFGQRQSGDLIIKCALIALGAIEDIGHALPRRTLRILVSGIGFAGHVEEGFGQLLCLIIGAIKTFAPRQKGQARTRRREFRIGRRILGAQGDLLGFVLVAMPFSYFESFYAKLATLPGMAITLIHLDGLVLSRFPPLDAGADSIVRARIGQAPKPGETRTLRAQTGMDGMSRVIVLRSLELNPLVIAVSRTRDALLEGWRRQRWLLLGSALLLGPAYSA